MIDWDSFDWQSFATLATGLAAVIGASIIGFKQAGISERQTAILERQVQLEEMKLRSDLYERRLAVYVATDAYISAAHADRPAPELSALNFRDTIDRSRFLFRPAVWAALEHISRVTGGLLYHRRRLDDFDPARAPAYPGEPTRDELIDTIMKTEDELARISAGLPDMFGTELQLSTPEQ